MTTPNWIQRSFRAVTTALAAMAVYAFPVAALAQEAVGDESWRTASRETIQGDTLVVAAYLALWFIIGIYVLRLATKQRVQGREIRELEKQVDDHSAK